MRELSLYILDIVQNSIAAEATIIEIVINEELARDIIEITIIDNGQGMTADQLKKVADPFYTSRNTRRVGLGIPLYKAHAEECEGDFFIASQVDQGTKVFASFKYSHIDRVPLGNIVATIITIISGNKDLRLIYKHSYNGQQFTFDTEEVKGYLAETPINSPLVLHWLKDYLQENLFNISN